MAALALLITKALHVGAENPMLGTARAVEGNFEIFHSGEDHIVIINGGKIMKRFNGSIIGEKARKKRRV